MVLTWVRQLFLLTRMQSIAANAKLGVKEIMRHELALIMEKGKPDRIGLTKIKTKRMTQKFPNNTHLSMLKKLLKFSDRYEISIQFWPKQIAVYIAKDGVDLTDFGGDFDFTIEKSIEYLNRITNGNLNGSKPPIMA